MSTKYVTEDELMEMFIESALVDMLTKTLPDAIETVIPQMPEEQQGQAFADVKAMKENPDAMFAEFAALKENGELESGEPDAPLDYESEAYKSFAETCRGLQDYFKKNQKMIADNFKAEFLKQGINLVINL